MCRVFRKTELTTALAAGLVVLAIAGMPTGAQAYTFDDVKATYWTGVEPDDGVNEAVMVIDWQEPETASMAFGYRWIGDAKGIDMLTAIDQADSRFHLEWHPDHVGALYGIGWDVDGDGFDKTDPDDYHAEGWMVGSWRYYLSLDGSSWSYSEAGVFGRDLVDGDWDAWSWAPMWQVSPPDRLPIRGDSNGDGVLDKKDCDNLISQFGGEPGTESADFNDDNIVNLADFSILRANFGTPASSAPNIGLATPAPEPTTVMLLILGGAGLLSRGGKHRIMRRSR
jgi:hypothetical protein